MGGICENYTLAHLFSKFKTVLKHSCLIKNQGLHVLSVKKNWRTISRLKARRPGRKLLIKVKLENDGGALK